MKFRQGASNEKIIHNGFFISSLIFCISFITYGLNPDYLLQGDAVYYANFIRNSQFDTLTLHNGYYFIAWITFHAFNLILPVDLDSLLVYLNIFFGALGLVVAFWLANDFLHNREQAAITILVLFLCGRYFNNATSAEIYIQQMFFVLLSFHLFMNSRFLLSGLCAVAALFITPLSVFAFLFYPVVFFWNRYQYRDMVPFILPFVLIYGIFFGMYYQELLFGTRGILVIADIKKFLPELAVINFLKFQIKHYSVLVIPACIGCYVIYRHRLLFRLMLAVCIPHVYLISKMTSEDHVFLMITDFFFSVLVALGLTFLSGKKLAGMAGGLLVLGHAGLLIYTIPVFSGDDRKPYAHEIQFIFNEYIKGKDALLVTDWSQRMALSYFNSVADGRALEAGEAYDKSIDEARLAGDSPQLKNFSGKLYVLDNYEVGGMTRLTMSDNDLMERHNQYSLWAKVQNILKTGCRPVFTGIRTLYECKWPVST